jgi:multiple sugar transport system permease protein/sn-glycerol 3-phosphate transport system permease protein
VRVDEADLTESKMDGLLGGPGVAALSPARRGRRRSPLDTRTAYLYILPAFAVLFIWHILPIFYVIWLSVTRGTAINAGFVGLKNYNDLLHDPEVHDSILATIKFTLGTVPAGTVLAILIALLLFDRLPGLGFFRTLVLLPFVTPVVATTIVWNWIFNPTYGFLDSILYALHLPTVNWFVDPFWAMIILSAYTIWHGVGFTAIIMLAGLTSIDSSIREAARVDGAGPLREFFSITLPLLSPYIFFVVVIHSIDSFKVFTQVLTLTGGGPGHFTELAGFLIYREAFSYFYLDYASALSVVVLLVVSMGTLLQFVASRRAVFAGEM